MLEIDNTLFVSQEDIEKYSQDGPKKDANVMLALVINPLTEDRGAHALRFPLPENTTKLVFGNDVLPRVGTWFDTSKPISIETQITPLFEEGMTVIFDSMKSSETSLMPITLLTGAGGIFFNTSTIDEFYKETKFTPLTDTFITGLRDVYKWTSNPVAAAVKDVYPMI